MHPSPSSPSSPHPPQRADAKQGLTPAEHLIFDHWARLFPTKPRPQRRAHSTLIRKLRIRLRDPHYRANILQAITIAAESPTLHGESWFTFEFLIRNDTNLDKILARWMQWADDKRRADTAALRRAQSTDRRRTADAAALADYKRRAESMSHEDRARLLDHVESTLGRRAYFDLLAHLDHLGPPEGSPS